MRWMNNLKQSGWLQMWVRRTTTKRVRIFMSHVEFFMHAWHFCLGDDYFGFYQCNSTDQMMAFNYQKHYWSQHIITRYWIPTRTNPIIQRIHTLSPVKRGLLIEGSVSYVSIFHVNSPRSSASSMLSKMQNGPDIRAWFWYLPNFT